MGKESEGAVHLEECSYDFLSKLNLLTSIQIVFELKVDIESASGDRPAKTAKDLIKR